MRGKRRERERYIEKEGRGKLVRRVGNYCNLIK